MRGVLGAYCKLQTQYFSINFRSKHKAWHHKFLEKNKDPQFTVRIEKTRLIRCLLYGFLFGRIGNKCRSRDLTNRGHKKKDSIGSWKQWYITSRFHKSEIKLMMHHVESLFGSQNLKSTVSLSLPIYRWSLLKTGCCICLKFAFIFLSLVFEKHCKWQRSFLRWSGVGTFVYFIAKGIPHFSFRKCLDYLQSCILEFLTVTYDKLFHHRLESWLLL